MGSEVHLSADEYERMKETIEVLSNQKLMAEIREGLKEFKEGKFVTLRKLDDEIRGSRSR